MQVNELHRLIGRTLVVGIRGSGPDSPEFRTDLEVCANACVGGIVLFDCDQPTGGERNIKSPAQVRELTACLRETLGENLLIMVDQEGGRVARLGAERGFDPGITASKFALLDESAQRSVAGAQANQLAGLGINVNLAPVVDLAIAQDSAVIVGLGRSFGVDPEKVTACARVWIEEHRRVGVASCLKHFPGHGSAIGDTHDELVDITDRTTRDEELTPYRALVGESGVMVMTGHLLDRAIDDELPASLSLALTGGALRRDMGFDGVIMTDSIDMGAICAHWSPGESAALAIGAGADLVMDGVNAPSDRHPCPASEISSAINDAIETGRIENGEQRLRIASARIDRLLGEIRRD